MRKAYPVFGARTDPVENAPAGRLTLRMAAAVRSRAKGVSKHLPSILFALAIAQLGMGFFSGKAALLLGAIVMGAILWMARPEFFPALMVNQLHALNFSIFGSQGSSSAPNLLNYALAVAIVGRVSIELFARPARFRSDRWLLVVWYAAMVPALIMAMMGRAEGNASWSLPLQTVWLCGGYFFGRMAGERSQLERPIFGKTMLPLICVFFLLFSMGWLSHKLMFILIPFVFPYVLFTWKKQSLGHKLVSCLSLIGCAYMGGAGGAAIALAEEGSLNEGTSSGLGGATLTMNGLFVGSVLLALAVRFSGPGLRRIWARALGWPAFAVVVVLSIAVAIVGPKFAIDTSAAKEALSLRERVQAKVFDDRSRIWSAALTDALEPPRLLKASGDILTVEHGTLGYIDWPHGAHNGVLNTLWRLRWIAGVLLLTLFGAVLHRSAKGLIQHKHGEVLALCVFVAITGTVGIAANDYPLDPLASFWFFSFAGVVSGAISRRGRVRWRTELHSGAGGAPG